MAGMLHCGSQAIGHSSYNDLEINMFRKTAIGILALVVPTWAFAGAIIGNWSGSARSWNNGEMSVLNASMIGAGHTVEADEAITAGNLANNDIFVVGEATGTPSGGELASLGAWVSAGGILLVLTDSGATGVPGGNGILSGILSGLSFGGSSPSVAAFPGGNFATTGGPFNLVGLLLGVTPGNEVLGGTPLAGDYIAYEALGGGHVFAFGDRSDHNFFGAGSTNHNFFLNIADFADGPAAVPEPATLALLGLDWRP